MLSHQGVMSLQMQLLPPRCRHLELEGAAAVLQATLLQASAVHRQRSVF
jgi:hypothetical protein